MLSFSSQHIYRHRLLKKQAVVAIFPQHNDCKYDRHRSVIQKKEDDVHFIIEFIYNMHASTKSHHHDHALKSPSRRTIPFFFCSLEALACIYNLLTYTSLWGEEPKSIHIDCLQLIACMLVKKMVYLVERF